MKMIGGNFDPRDWNKLQGGAHGLWKSIQPHAGTLFGATICPVQKDVMKESPSMPTVVEADALTGESASMTG